ncbi:hypothetical protein BS50DRAFT_78650 [Corynespora cassiicola Philippines]|uniref:DUF7791 domain-containing protein n=1 Tax=Corynespora cassiicola Philippines TaxID=1448308 RepID=A0A2T2NGT0_CORCC|nr:hypothetical protein BS50DRAFT_78650 [Corynespora cassiicola Philippines]
MWVKIVIKSLINRLSAGNYLHELEKAVNHYPKELHSLYIHMFERMDPEYRLQASKLFQYIFTSMNTELESITAVRLGSIEEYRADEVLDMPYSPISLREAKAMVEDLEGRLRSRCCGLFEMHRFTNTEAAFGPIEGRIIPLHRSVWDFWNTPAIQKMIKLETMGDDFQPRQHLLTSILFQVKKMFIVKPNTKQEKARILNIIKDFFKHCKAVENFVGESQYRYLQQIHQVLSMLWETKSWRLLDRHDWGNFVSNKLSLLIHARADQEPLLVLASFYRLFPYVELWAREFKSLEKSKILRTILIRLLTWSMCSPSAAGKIEYARIARILLQSGYDVSTYDHEGSNLSESPWKRFLQIEPFKVQIQSLPTSEIFKSQDRVGEALDTERFMAWGTILEGFLDAGAELDRPYKENPSKLSARKITQMRIRAMEITSNDDNVHGRISELRKALQDVPYDASIETSETIQKEELQDRIRRRKEQRKEARDRKQRLAIEAGPNGTLLSDPKSKCNTPIPSQSRCSRCETIERLGEFDFTVSKTLAGMEQANCGNDISAIVNYILNNLQETAEPPSGSSVYSSQVMPNQRVDPGVDHTNKSISSSATPKQKPEMQTEHQNRLPSKQWTHVSKQDTKKKENPSNSHVVGANFRIGSPKPKKKHNRGMKTPVLERGSQIVASVRRSTRMT